MHRGLTLLSQNDLLKTGEVDHADWNYRPGLGMISRRRFALIRQLLPDDCNRLLEIGYGSGVFLPELAKHSKELYGIDPHPFNREVAATLAKRGIEATLTTAGAERLPFPDGFFDTVVCVSALEFVNDVVAASSEIARVLNAHGRAIVVTPPTHPIYDFALNLATGKSAQTDFGGRRSSLIERLETRLEIEKNAYFPAVIGVPPIYRAIRLKAKFD